MNEMEDYARRLFPIFSFSRAGYLPFHIVTGGILTSTFFFSAAIFFLLVVLFAADKEKGRPDERRVTMSGWM